MSEMDFPTYADVEDARDFIRPYLQSTPLVYSWSLSELLGCDYYIKCENLQPVGAFKVRGGVYLVGHLSKDERAAGIVSASTGNHGQSLAYAGRIFDVPVTIFGPEKNANQAKVAAMRGLGAQVRLFGEDFDEAREEAGRFAEKEGARFVHSANERRLVAGVGTMALEIFSELPDVEVIVAPVGGGSGVCGNALVAKERGREVEIIAVQSALAPVCYRAWKERRLDVEAPMATVHEGVATRVPFAMTMQMMWQLVDDFVLVEDEEINAAIRLLAARAKLVAEGAGAASLAAVYKLQEQLRGKKVVGILTGGNVDSERLARTLSA
ncbi:MAG: threonine ammonia-lyase [Candidatus Latescibacterota bacterium]|jgi:threonine dehydratase